MGKNSGAAVRRQKEDYFKPVQGAPRPIAVTLKKRVSFNDVDVMGIVWHGNYAKYFEEASAELGRKCGFSYLDYDAANLRAPIVQLHVDYHEPLMLEEIFTVKASLVWSEGARLHTEYAVIKENGAIATTGYTVQMYIDSETKEVQLTPPDILEQCRRRWKAGELG